MAVCNPRNRTLFNNSEACFYVLSTSQCSFDSGFINYIVWEYCGFYERAAPTFLILLWFMVLLLSVAITADSFFAPCLVVVAKLLRMSENLAGVTLLALGNGAADVFSSLSAVLSSSTPNVELALGSILGAGILVNTIAAGIIIIICPFTVKRRPIMKDLLFYLFGLIWVMVILIKREIELWTSLLLFILYVIFVIVTVVSRTIYMKLKKQRMDKELQGIDNDFYNDQTIGDDGNRPLEDFCRNGYRGGQINPYFVSEENDPKSEDPVSIRSMNVEKSVRISDELRDILISRDLQRIHCLKTLSLRSTHHRTLGSFAKIIMERQLEAELRKINKSALVKPRSSSCDAKHDHRFVIQGNRIDIIDHGDRTNFEGEGGVWENKILEKRKDLEKKSKEKKTETDEVAIVKKTSVTNIIDNFIASISADNKPSIEFPGLIKHFLLTILPVQLEDWKEKSLFHKVFSIVQSPIVLILTLTIPVVEEEAYLKGWCKILNCLHCIFSPVIWITFMKVTTHRLGGSDFLLIYLVIIIGIILATVVAMTSKADSPPVYYWVYSFIGFITSIFWIYVSANEIVNILETFQIVFDIPETILGLSVLAFANSIGDLVSNIILAKKNFPRIAYAACIGGPLFNLLIGIGLPFTIGAARHQSIKLDLRSETIVLIFTILLITLMNIIVLPLLRFNLKRFYGILLICIYLLYFVVVFLFASNVIKVIP